MARSSQDIRAKRDNLKRRRRELAGLRNTAANAGPPSSSKTFGTTPPPQRGPGKAIQQGYKPKETKATRVAGALLPFIAPDPKVLARGARDWRGTLLGAVEAGTFVLPQTQATRLRNQLTGGSYFDSLTGADVSDIEQAVEFGGLIPTGKVASSAAKITLKGATEAGRRLGRSGLEATATGLVKPVPKTAARKQRKTPIKIGIEKSGRFTPESVARLANDTAARIEAKQSLESRKGSFVAVGDEQSIPFRAWASYGETVPVDTAWAESIAGLLNRKKQTLSSRPQLLGLSTEEETSRRIISTGKGTFSRGRDQAVENGSLIRVVDEGNKTIGYKPQTKLSRIDGPFKKGKAKMARLFYEERISDPSLDYYPGGIPEEIKRSTSILSSARKTSGLFKAKIYSDKRRRWVDYGSDEIDHNNIGQRLLYNAGIRVLDRAGRKESKSLEDEIVAAYDVLSGRLDATTRGFNQSAGSNLRTGDLTDPAYKSVKEMGLENQLLFLVDEGHMLQIHGDNWELFKTVAPNIARELSIMSRELNLVRMMQNPRATKITMY